MAKRYTAEIKTLQRCIKEMEQMKEILWNLEENAISIENELCDLDAVLPMKEDMAKIKDPKEREQLKKALDLLEQSFSLIDDILGPPQDEMDHNQPDISLDNVLSMMNSISKKHCS